MGFKLSTRSTNRMSGIEPDLIEVVKTAITLTKVDFGVTEGVRSIETQDLGTSCKTTGECVAIIATPFRSISKSERAILQ